MHINSLSLSLSLTCTHTHAPNDWSYSGMSIPLKLKELLLVLNWDGGNSLTVLPAAPPLCTGTELCAACFLCCISVQPASCAVLV